MQTKINTTGDSYGVFDPHIVRVEMERAFTLAWTREQTRIAREARSEARFIRRAAHAQQQLLIVEPDHTTIPATPSITLDDWYSEAPRSTGEEAVLVPDADDEDVRLAALTMDREQDVEVVANRFGWDVAAEAETLAWCDSPTLLTDRATVAWLGRDELPAGRVAWTEQDENRVTLMNLRYRWLDSAKFLASKNRRRSVADVRHFPALKSMEQHAESLTLRWSFKAELLRHRVDVSSPRAVAICKQALGRTYREALAEARRIRVERAAWTPFAA